MPTTIQTETVCAALRRLGHATNLELHAAVTDKLRHLALTSLHRITARMVDRGQIGLAPSDGRQVILDARPEVHDHFVCTVCGGILDIVLPDSAIAAIQEQLGQNLVRDGIVVRGRCERCGSLSAESSVPLH